MLNIMLIDDDPRQLVLFKAILQKANYRVSTHLSAIEAMQWLDTKPVDLILLDLALPVMNGFEFFEFVRKLEKFKEIPVVVITAHADLDTEVKCHRAGFTDLIKKPVTSQVLHAKIAKYLPI